MCINCWIKRKLPQLPQKYKPYGIKWLEGIMQESNDLQRMYAMRVILYLFNLSEEEVKHLHTTVQKRTGDVYS